ncbi:MAG: hypothetical protein Q8L48_34965 [Archangium sp.]|nr:hypothetical protein [Archangium sp.]
MSLEKGEVERSIRELGLAEQLRAIPDDEARRLWETVEDRFADKKGARWIWEHHRVPSFSRQFRHRLLSSRHTRGPRLLVIKEDTLSRPLPTPRHPRA